MTSTRALVIVPTYNERKNLPALVDALMLYPNVRVLIVDNQSPDGTGDVADQLARTHAGRIEVMHRMGSRGLGRSYIDGIAKSLHDPVDAICQMNADLSHDPRQLPSLLAATERADVVIGSRYVPGGAVVNRPRHRQLFGHLANVYIRLITRLSPHDCTSGYRCWRREALAKMPLEQFTSSGCSLLIEMLYVAAGKGLRIAEVPITFVERPQGPSTLSCGTLLESALTPWRLVARGRSSAGA